MADEKVQTDREMIEISEPGLYEDSNCVYTLTNDITSRADGLVFDGTNYVVDLNGKTLTFNTEHCEGSAETPYFRKAPVGVLLKGTGVELAGGTIVQGSGADNDASCVSIRATNCDVHDTTTVISGGSKSVNLLAKDGGQGVSLHHNYVVNHSNADKGWYGAVSLRDAGTDWDIHHNTIVGGHQGILVAGRRDNENVRIHHNYIQHQRTRGQKVPQGIYVRASGCEIDHNEIVTIDGRGLEPTRPNNHWHDNIVDIRYTSRADGGFYSENRCYGYWARNPDGNRITNNLFVVTNEVIGDETSNTIGIQLITDGGRTLRNCTVVGNRLYIDHEDKTRPAWGVLLRKVGDQVVFKDNYIWARTAGVLFSDEPRGVTFEDNTFVQADDDWQAVVGWEGGTGEGIINTTFKNNKVVAPPQEGKPPGAPTGLEITRRINGFELHWSPSKAADVLGYYVYRDGKRVEDRLKCGRFYVDTAAADQGECEYAVSAVSTTRVEGPRCKPAQT